MAPPDQSELNKSLIEELRSLNVLNEATLETFKNIGSEEYKILENSRKRVASLKEQRDTSKAILTDISEQYKITGMDYELEKRNFKLQEDALRVALKNKKIDQDTYILRMKELLASKEKLEIDEEGYKTTKKVFDLLGMIPAKDSFINKITEDPGKFFEGVSKGFKDFFNPANLAISLIEKFIESSIELSYAQDTALKTSNKLTGQIDFMNGSLTIATNQLAGTGVSAEDAGKAYTELFQNVNSFSKMSAMSQETMIETVALLDKMGVSSEFTTKNIGDMTRVFKMSGASAARFQTGFSTLANNLKMDIGQITSGFSSVSDTMYAVASSPDQLAESFGNLARISKSTGISIEGLVKITERFDTFEGAAESVGKLNSILQGPYLSAMEMIQETDPAERMKKISQAIQQSGKSFDQLSYYEKKAYKDALGLETMADLASVMAGNVEGIGDPMANMDSKSLIRMKAEQAAFNDVMESFNNLLKSIAIGLGPLITGLAALLQGLTVITPVLKPLIMSFAILKTGPLIAQGFTLMSSSITAAGGAIKFMSTQVGKLNAVSKASIIGMLFYYGLTMVESYVDGYEQLFEAIKFGSLAFSFLAMGIQAVGAAERKSFLLGAAGAIALTALAYAFDYFSVGAVEGHSPAYIFALMSLAFAIHFLSKAAKGSTAGIIQLTIIFAAIALTALSIGASVMMIGKGFELMGMSVKLGAEGFESLAKSISDISILKIMAVTAAIYNLADAMNDIPLMKTLAMTAMIGVSSMASKTAAEGVNNTAKAIASGVTPGVSPAVSSLPANATGATIAASTVTINTTNEVTTNSTTNQGGSAGSQSGTSISNGKPAELVFNLQLSIDGTQFTKAVNKVKVDPMKDKALYDSIREMIQRGMA